MITEQHIDYLAHVLRCAITGENIKDFPAGMNVEEFMEFCRFHNIDNIVYIAIGSRIGGELGEKLEDTYHQKLKLHATQQYYLEEIENTFEENGIDYLVLKGRELAKLYPSEDMRQSSDCDIYIGRDNAARAKELMLNMGFKIEAYNEYDDNHDEYTIDRMILCELHRVLIQDKHPWQKECNRIPQRLILCDGTKHCYRMSPEDFYVYNLAHTAKHMKLSGIGIKVFLDQWLIYSKFKDVFDYDYLNNTLKLARLDKFEKNVRDLYEYWFDGKTPDNPEMVKQMAEYVAQSGWIGTSEQFVATEMAANAGKTNSTFAAKVKLCIDIICSPYKSMAERYPILEKHRWLTPIYRIHRLLDAALHKRDLVKKVTGVYDNADMDYGKRIVKFKEDLGL